MRGSKSIRITLQDGVPQNDRLRRVIERAAKKLLEIRLEVLPGLVEGLGDSRAFGEVDLLLLG